jgi:acetyltransferase-like isoleucine patch superfamily enzyme
MLLRKITSASCRLYNYHLRRQGARIQKTFRCFPGAVEGEIRGLSGKGAAIFERGARLLIGMNNNGSPGELEIGERVYVNRYTIVDCHYHVVIGNSVQIGPLCYITDFDHSIRVNADPAIQRSEKTYKAVTIKDNAWLGAGCIILKGVTIGMNAVIGAGSVITRDVPDNTVVAGNPQHVIRTL